MEVVKSLLLICMLLVYPLLPGGALLGVIKRKKNEFGLGNIWIAGVLLCGVLFGMLAFFGVRLGVSLDLFSKAALSLGLLLLLFSAAVLGLFRSCRKGFAQAFAVLKKKPDRAEICMLFAFCLVAVLYLIHPFSVEPSHDTAEKVITHLDTGMLSGVDAITGETVPVAGNWKEQLENLPLFYACLCKWSGLSPADVLFDVIPYVVLLWVFAVISLFADFVFEKQKRNRAAALVVFAVITLCGNMAYMNTSYGLLHYPYEAMTIFSSILLPLVFYMIWAHEHVLLFLLVCVNAVFAAGVEKAVAIFLFMTVCYVLTLVVTRLAERRES